MLAVDRKQHPYQYISVFVLMKIQLEHQLKFPPAWMAASTWLIVHLEHEGYLYMV